MGGGQQNDVQRVDWKSSLAMGGNQFKNNVQRVDWMSSLAMSGGQ